MIDRGDKMLTMARRVTIEAHTCYGARVRGRQVMMLPLIWFRKELMPTQIKEARISNLICRHVLHRRPL